VKYILIFSAVIFLFGCNEGERTSGKTLQTSRETRTATADKSAPDFTVSTIDGRSVSLASLKGKVVIIDFWATWCGPCVYEIPGFIRLYEKYKDRGLEIIGLSVDRNRSAVVDFARRKGINYHIAFADRDIQAKYGGIQAIPTTFFIDRDGNIAGSVVGARDEAFFEEEVKKLL
jgi:thiol-disulfide isomerase/thioredoxin